MSNKPQDKQWECLDDPKPPTPRGAGFIPPITPEQMAATLQSVRASEAGVSMITPPPITAELAQTRVSSLQVGLYAVAVICFLISAFKVEVSPNIDMTALGLVFLTLAHLFFKV